MLHAFARDLRFARWQFAGRLGFTCTVVFVLALGLGANTAIFSVVHAFLLRPLPYPQPNSIVAISERVTGNAGEQGMNLSPGNFLDWRKQATAIEQMSAFTGGASVLTSPNNEFEPERVQVCNASGNFMATLGVAPLSGRPFAVDEDRSGAPRVAILSYRLWQRRFRGAPDIVGKSIRLDGDDYHVIAVMPRGFLFPNDTTAVWTPLLAALPPTVQIRRDLHFLQAIGRIRAGLTLQQSRAELDGIAARYKREHPEIAMGNGAILTPLHDVLVRDAHTSLLILMGAVGCLLLIACFNLANLLLTRSSARARELSIRAAVGASRGEIIRQLLTESALLALAGGAAGLLLACLLSPVLLAHAPGVDAVVSRSEFSFQPAVFLFAFGMALVTGLAVGLYPALVSSRADLAAGLREATRSSTPGRSHARFRGALISAEVALSVVLLVGAGLLLRSFSLLIQAPSGFRTDHLLTMRFQLPSAYKAGAGRSAFFQQAARRLQTIPGVSAAGLSSCPPLSGYCNGLFFYREDRPFVQGRYSMAREWSVDPNFLAAAGLPLRRGRNFTARDGIGFDAKSPRPGAILISESMAREFFPGEDPIGKRIFFDYEVQRSKLEGAPTPKYEIIGIVGDTAAFLDRKPQSTLYRPLLDGLYGGATILLRTDVTPSSVATAALCEIHALDRSLAVYDVRTMEEAIGRSAADRKFTMLLFASFAGLAVLLAAVGLYGVLSYAVSQRRGEIGVRIALGASGSDVRRLVVWQGMKPAMIGVAAGLAAAYFACRLLKSMLFGIVPLDAVTFSLMSPLMLALSALACYLPAIRATRIDPTVALRSE